MILHRKSKEIEQGTFSHKLDTSFLTLFEAFAWVRFLQTLDTPLFPVEIIKTLKGGITTNGRNTR